MPADIAHIGDRPDDERSQARAISEILVRLGSLEGELHAVRMSVRNIDAEHERALQEFRQGVRAVRTSVGRAVAASQRIASLGDEIRDMRRRMDACPS